MKKSIIFSILVLALSFVCCSRQDDTYSQYIVKGGYNYPAKPTQLVAVPGYYNVVLAWATPLDPAVKSVKLFWDNYAESMDVSYSDAKDGILIVTVPDLEERSYTFNVINYDGSGNKSLAAEVTASPYGEGWLCTHAERRVPFAKMQGDSAVVTLGTPVDEMVATMFRYRNSKGEIVESEPVPVDSMSATLKDALRGKYFEYRSSYRPANGYQAVWNLEWSKSATPIYYNLASADWDITVTEKQYRDNNYLPKFMFDGNIETMYHSSTNSGLRNKWPKIVSVDTKAEGDKIPTIVGINVIQHPDQAKSRYVRSIGFYVGDSAFNPDDASYATTYGEPALEATLRQDVAEQSKDFAAPVTGRYFAIVFKNSYNTSGGYISAYEFEVLGYTASDID